MTTGATGCVERWRHALASLVVTLVAALGLVLATGAATATTSTYGYDRSPTPLAVHPDEPAVRSSSGSGRAAGSAVSSLATSNFAASVVAANSETTLYRAVSTAERADIEAFQRFRVGPNSYEGKLVATSAEDDARYGRINDAPTPAGERFHIVETLVPTSLANSFERMTLDSMQAVHVAEDQLGALNTAGRWTIYDWVPWVGKLGAGF
jgi:hypothetical protein